MSSNKAVAEDRAFQRGIVFNIQKYAVHDGPGIRTVVFLKGCPLRCKWCSNPESQQLQPQLAVNREKCLGFEVCRHCRAICPRSALSADEDGRVVRDSTRCDDCLACGERCPAEALNVYGRQVSVAEVLKRVQEDEVFYSRSGGGLTLGGGEPLFQAEFALALLREARRRRLDTAIETCGHVPWSVLEAAARCSNSIYYDLKCIDAQRHLRGTGVSNERILDNLHRLKSAFAGIPLTVRTPVVAGFNDSREEIVAITDFIRDLPDTRYELLPYHRLGTPKYGYLGRADALGAGGVVSERRMARLRSLARERLTDRFDGRVSDAKKAPEARIDG